MKTSEHTTRVALRWAEEPTRTVEPLRPINRYSLLIALCVVGILIANAYSLMITNNGLLVSNIFPDLRVLTFEIPQSTATFVFAGVMQFGIMVLYLLLALSRPAQRLAVLPFLGTLVAVSFYFGFLSVHSNSRGDAYVASVGKRIDNLRAGIEGELQFIASGAREALDGALKSAEASKRGLDRTGVATCGPICQGYFDRAQKIQSGFGHLLEIPAEPPQDQDVRSLWRDTSSLFTAYAARSQDYGQLLGEIDPARGYEVNPQLRSEHDYLSRMFGKGLDDRWMMTAQSLRDMGQDLSVIVSALISILPDVINLALALTIGALSGISRRGIAARRAGKTITLTAAPSARAEPVIGALAAPAGVEELGGTHSLDEPQPERTQSRRERNQIAPRTVTSRPDSSSAGKTAIATPAFERPRAQRAPRISVESRPVPIRAGARKGSPDADTSDEERLPYISAHR